MQILDQVKVVIVSMSKYCLYRQMSKPNKKTPSQLIVFDIFRQRSGAYEYNMTPENRKFTLLMRKLAL